MKHFIFIMAFVGQMVMAEEKKAAYPGFVYKRGITIIENPKFF